MRGHIEHRRYKNKQGELVESPNWTITIELDPDPITGKRKQQRVTVEGDQDAAEKKLTELQHQKDTGSAVQTGKIKLNDYLTRWLSEYVKVNLSPKTTEGYEFIINRYIIPYLGSLNLTNLRPEHIQRFYSEEISKGLSAQTVRHHHMLLHKALDNGVEWGLLARNVADAVKPPRAQRLEMQVWNEEEVLRFLNATEDSQYRELFTLALYTGMRRSELLGLRWSDCDLILGQIHVNRALHVLKGHKVIFRTPKTASGRRSIALSPSTSIILREYLNNRRMDAAMADKHISDDDLVFSNLDGSPLLPGSISHAWKRLAEKAGVKHIRLHDSRHTHASLLLKAGVHPKIVSERLGHSSIQITLDVYSHVVPGLQEAAAQRFDDILKVADNKNASVHNSVHK